MSAAAIGGGTEITMARRHNHSRRPPDNRSRRDVIFEKIEEELEFPRTAIASAVHIELCGNREAIVDGCKGVLEYDDTVIRLNTGKLVVRFTGSDLCINTYNMDTAIIQGNILSIDYSS